MHLVYLLKYESTKYRPEKNALRYPNKVSYFPLCSRRFLKNISFFSPIKPETVNTVNMPWHVFQCTRGRKWNFEQKMGKIIEKINYLCKNKINSHISGMRRWGMYKDQSTNKQKNLLRIQKIWWNFSQMSILLHTFRSNFIFFFHRNITKKTPIPYHRRLLRIIFL